MTLEVDAIYVNGVLKPEAPVSLQEGQRVRLVIHEQAGRARSGYGLLPWTGRVEDLDALINDPENDSLERP